MKYAHIGSLSHGTLLPEDLLEEFTNELHHQIDRNRGALDQQEVQRLEDLFLEADATDPDDADEIIGALMEELNAFAAPYCYFGTHPGDASDFGYWPDMGAIDELSVVEDSDEARALGEDCKSVNDHGNVTVYGGDGSVLLDLV